MRWLHISDLHFGIKKYQDEIATMRKGLLEDLTQQIKPIHCLFITGDLRYAPDSGKTFPSEIRPYIENLRGALGVHKQDVFIVQGNHDVNRDADGGRAFEKAVASFLDDYQTNAGHFSETTQNFIQVQRKPYRKLYRDIQGVKEPGWHYCVQRYGYNILCLNTAMVSCRDREDGSLILGSELIEKMFSDEKQVVPGLPIIVLAHHDWRALHPSEQDKFRNIDTVS